MRAVARLAALILSCGTLIEPAAAAAFDPSGTLGGWLPLLARIPGGDFASALAFLGIAALVGFLAGVLPRRTGNLDPQIAAAAPEDATELAASRAIAHARARTIQLLEERLSGVRVEEQQGALNRERIAELERALGTNAERLQSARNDLEHERAARGATEAQLSQQLARTVTLERTLAERGSETSSLRKRLDGAEQRIEVLLSDLDAAHETQATSADELQSARRDVTRLETAFTERGLEV